MAGFVLQVRSEQHHHLIDHQPAVARLGEDALVILGEQQGQDDLLDQLPLGLLFADQHLLGLQARQ